VKTCAEA
jgi:hypothetical protein